jgi:predicted MFS family arabinose efflux permease
LSGSVRLSLAGFFATAVAFGPARMGYGLFLPEFREEFALSTEASGFIASAAFAGFFLALLLTGFLTARFGSRVPVVAGGLSAFSGMAVVAFAPGVAVLALGIVLAATSAGFSWVPYNNFAERAVPERRRGRVLSVVSTGTTFGITAAGLLGLAIVFYGLTWRLTWALFAASGLAAAALNASVLGGNLKSTGTPATGEPGKQTGSSLKSLGRAEAVPLFAASLSFGATNSVYLSFAVDHISRVGGLGSIPMDASGPILFTAFGAAGAVGLFTGDVEKRFGLVHLLRIIFVCSFASLALLGAAPGSWLALLASAAFQGGCLMTISAVFSFWSLRLFPHLPSLSFTAVLLVFATGNVAGPALAGLAAGQLGLGTTFLAAGGLSLLTALTLPRRVAGDIYTAS